MEIFKTTVDLYRKLPIKKQFSYKLYVLFTQQNFKMLVMVFIWIK